MKRWIIFWPQKRCYWLHSGMVMGWCLKTASHTFEHFLHMQIFKHTVREDLMKCSKSPPPLHHHHIHPELLILDWMDPCFHGVHTKFWPFVNHSLTFLLLSDRSSIVVVSCCCSSFSSRLKLLTYFADQSLAFLIINRDFPTHPPYFLVKRVFVFSTSPEQLSTQTNNYSMQTHELISEYAKICMACALLCCYMCFGLKCILFQNLLKTAHKVF